MARNPGGAAEFPQLPAIPANSFPEEAQKAVGAFNEATEKYYRKLNGQISLGTRESLEAHGSAWSGHLDGNLIWVTVPEANADFPVAHGLERIPLGFLELDQTSVNRLHRLATTPANTTTFLWVRSAAPAGTRYLVLVV